MSALSVKVSGGRLVSRAELAKLVEGNFDPALRRAGLARQGALQKAAPVVTGNLRRSAAVSAPEWRGTVRRVSVGFGAVYARRVNVRGRSAGYVERGVQNGAPGALQELGKGVASLARVLWVK